MEAKVDIRKLQLLNDRINQTIDALNQVRLSVHGLGHTGGIGMGTMGPMGTMGVPFGGQVYPQQPFGQQVYPQQPFGQQVYPQQVYPQQGFGHTGGMPGVQNPMFQNPLLAQLLGVNPLFQTGISHTGPEQLQDPQRAMLAQWMLQQQLQTQVDPYYGIRMSQTFPYAQWPISPVG